jgi:hypothetical protein
LVTWIENEGFAFIENSERRMKVRLSCGNRCYGSEEHDVGAGWTVLIGADDVSRSNVSTSIRAYRGVGERGDDVRDENKKQENGKDVAIASLE